MADTVSIDRGLEEFRSSVLTPASKLTVAVSNNREGVTGMERVKPSAQIG
jgi:hypothetical protein